MEKQIEEIIDSCYDEETTINKSGNIEGGRLTLNKEKLIKEISELFKGMYEKEFVHYLLTETNYPLLFAEISKEKTEEHYVFWKENLKEFIEWRDKNCRITPNGNYQQKYKHESKTPQELYRHWIENIKDK